MKGAKLNADEMKSDEQIEEEQREESLHDMFDTFTREVTGREPQPVQNGGRR